MSIPFLDIVFLILYSGVPKALAALIFAYISFIVLNFLDSAYLYLSIISSASTLPPLNKGAINKLLSFFRSEPNRVVI